MTQTINHAALSQLVETGALKGAHIVGHSGGWSLRVEYGTAERPLATQRSQQVRLFRKFETLVAYLQKLGIVHFDVDSAHYQNVSKQPRPDRTEALKRAHKAASYDTWFREQVQASIDDPRPNVPNEEARAQFAAKKTALQQAIS